MLCYECIDCVRRWGRLVGLTLWFGFTHAGHDARWTVLLCVSLSQLPFLQPDGLDRGFRPGTKISKGWLAGWEEEKKREGERGGKQNKTNKQLNARAHVFFFLL